MREINSNEEVIKEVLRLPCPSCGSKMSYSAEAKAINCNHCNFVQPFSQSNSQIKEQCLKEAKRATFQFTPKAISKKVIDCKSCGSQLMIESNEVAVRCNFCGSEKVNEKAFEKNLIQPQGIIPFTIAKKEATQKFQKWIKEGWFRPNKLKILAELGDIHGIYVPFWTYDAQTYTAWSGQAGYHYYETETVYRDGKPETEQVRKTRWQYKSGSFYHFFDDMLIVASKGLPHKVITPIFPYDLNQLINYTNELLVGWESEIYSVDVFEGYDIAERKMDIKLEEMAEKALGGDEQRDLDVEGKKWAQTYKLVVLPVWLCSYIYNDKTYQFAINGQTGKINGTKPVSVFKIIGLIILIILIIAAIVMAVNS